MPPRLIDTIQSPRIVTVRRTPSRKNGARSFRFGVAVTAIVVASMPANVQTPAEFYKGRTVTIMLGSAPGGSYTIYAILAANHLKRHVPGNPHIVIEHRPGGG